MKHFKKPDNSVWAFESDGSQDSFITSDMQPVDDAELAELRKPAPVDPKIEAAAKISALESQTLLPRVVREYIMGAFKAEALKLGLDPMLLPAYVKVKALDDQIAALRAQL